MKLTDLDLLLYAIDGAPPRHDPARTWLEAQRSGTETFAFAWAVLVGFVRLGMNHRVFSTPLATRDTFEIIRGWLAQPFATVVHATERHGELLRELLEPPAQQAHL